MGGVGVGGAGVGGGVRRAIFWSILREGEQIMTRELDASVQWF